MKKILKAVPYIIIAILVGITAVYAEPLNKLIAPGPVSNTMYSLTDIWNLATGTTTDEGIGTIDSTPDVTMNTGKTLTQVYEAISGEIAKLSSGVIASGTTAFGIEGSESVVDTSDADATADDILTDKTAYVNGEKITGVATAGTNYSLQKTRQTTVYQAGDDGTYQKGFTDTRFINNGNNTITDNATGLMWIKDHNAVGFPLNEVRTWTGAITNCEALSYAGFSDWRLPNVVELVSLVDYSRNIPSINPLFTNTNYNQRYWTSNTETGFSTWALCVSFAYGSGAITDQDKTDVAWSRCVR